LKANAGNACSLKSQQYISKRVVELQEEQLAIHQQATAAAAVSAQVTIESLIAEAEAARAKAMSEKGGAAAAVSALTAKAKLNWSSHAADAFGYMAVCYEEPPDRQRPASS
jgi:hypothetical protein